MRRVTQRDVAKACGVSGMTVSMALRGHRSIPQATRERILEKAQSMGYRRDPALQALVAHRIGMEKPAFHGTVAWITAWERADGWRENPTYTGYFGGLEVRAGELGYELESVWLGEYNWNGAAAAKALQARGIDGVIFAPRPHGRVFDFPYQQFSCVRVGLSLHEPGIPAVAADLRRAVSIALHEAIARGYRRIGLADSANDMERLNGLRLAQFNFEQQRLPESEQVPPLQLKPGDAKSLCAYVRRERIGALIAVWPNCYDWLQKGGITIPDELGYIQLGDFGPAHLAKVLEPTASVGVHAMNLLDQHLRFNQRGLTHPPFRIIVEPHWADGDTLPPK